MSDQPSKDERARQAANVVPATPSEIARNAATEAAASLKAAIRDPAKEIEMERSGQLSPPHTPGRGQK